MLFSHLKVVGRRTEYVKEAGQTVGIGSTDHGPIHVSIPSGTSQGSGEWNFAFDFKPSSFDQGDLFSDSYSKSKNNDPDSGSNDSEVVKNVDSEVNLWHFKDAFSEAQVRPLTVSQLHLASSFLLSIIKFVFLYS